MTTKREHTQPLTLESEFFLIVVGSYPSNMSLLVGAQKRNDV